MGLLKMLGWRKLLDLFFELTMPLSVLVYIIIKLPNGYAKIWFVILAIIYVILMLVPDKNKKTQEYINDMLGEMDK